MRTIAVIGKNFGDEGKGLAVNYFAQRGGKTLIIRHNGGAQSGHTVAQRSPEEKRFVFHELSAGSGNGSETLWIESFYPDIYKLGEEVENFREVFGFIPVIYGMERVCITIADDVLLNMALEASRGSQRHGSCGMGINECDLRTNAGFGLSLGQISGMDAEALYRALKRIRKEYTAKRLRDLSESINAEAAEYVQLLSNDNVLINAAYEILENMKHVTLLTDSALRKKLQCVDTLLFESGQGLLLDRNKATYAPHVTASDTGLTNPCSFLRRFGLALDEAVYVSRTYVTRHGAGPLPNECSPKMLGNIGEDGTNKQNAWQGALRYGQHEDENDFVAAVRDDLVCNRAKGCKVSLFLTHLNETEGCVVLKNEKVPAEIFVERSPVKDTFGTVYLSDSEYSEDTKIFARNGID